MALPDNPYWPCLALRKGVQATEREGRMTARIDALRREVVAELCRLACSEADGDYERILELHP